MKQRSFVEKLKDELHINNVPKLFKDGSEIITKNNIATFLLLGGILQGCQTTKSAQECSNDFKTEVVAGQYCMQIKVKKSKETLTSQPRIYFLFTGDGNSYTNFTYWDGLYNRLNKKEGFQDENIVLVTLKYPAKDEYVTPIDNEESRILAMNQGIKQIIQHFNPYHIEHWGQSGGGMRAIFSAALSPEIPIDHINTFNTPCDVASYTSRTIKVDNPYLLMDPKKYIPKISQSTTFGLFGTTNDHIVNFEEDNQACKKILEDNGYSLEYYHEFAGIGHTNLKDSKEYLALNQTIIDPTFDPGIPRNMSKQEVAMRLKAAEEVQVAMNPYMQKNTQTQLPKETNSLLQTASFGTQLSGAEQDLFQTFQRQDQTLTQEQFLNEFKLETLPGKTIIITIGDQPGAQDPLLEDVSIIKVDANQSIENIQATVARIQKMQKAENVIVIGGNIKNSEHIFTAKSIADTTKFIQLKQLLERNRDFQNTIKQVVETAKVTGILPPDITALLK